MKNVRYYFNSVKSNLRKIEALILVQEKVKLGNSEIKGDIPLKKFVNLLINKYVVKEYTVNMKGIVRCDPRKHRSLNDLYRIVKYYYPNITISDMVCTLVSLWKEKKINTLFCSNIMRRTFFEEANLRSYTRTFYHEHPYATKSEYEISLSDYTNYYKLINEKRKGTSSKNQKSSSKSQCFKNKLTKNAFLFSNKNGFGNSSIRCTSGNQLTARSTEQCQQIINEAVLPESQGQNSCLVYGEEPRDILPRGIRRSAVISW